MTLTVAICTYRRPELLRQALRSLAPQITDPETIKLLVVDNACQDEVVKVANEYNAHYVPEPRVGLSHARNRALDVVDTTHLLYFDDDAIAATDLIENLRGELIRRPAIDAIGGWYSHYFTASHPKWIIYQYRQPVRASQSDRTCILPPDSYLSGGLMAFNVSVLRNLGGFTTGYGMSGDQIGYGEEDELQDRLRAQGGSVYFSPHLKMSHLVHPRKYSIQVQLRMAYESGRAFSTLKSGSPLRLRGLILELARAGYHNLPKAIAKLAIRRGYYWQNAILDVARRMAWLAGRYHSLQSRDISTPGAPNLT